MSIEDLINHVGDQDFAKAGPLFNEIIGSKIQDALDAEQIRIANSVFNNEELNDDDIEEEDIDEDEDEDIEEEDE